MSEETVGTIKLVSGKEAHFMIGGPSQIAWHVASKKCSCSPIRTAHPQFKKFYLHQPVPKVEI